MAERAENACERAENKYEQATIGVDGDEPTLNLIKKKTKLLNHFLRLPQALQDADSGDEDFWNQDFFAEDAGDAEYSTESAPSDDDEAGSDFSESEEEEDESASASGEEEIFAETKRKKKTSRWWSLLG